MTLTTVRKWQRKAMRFSFCSTSWKGRIDDHSVSYRFLRRCTQQQTRQQAKTRERPFIQPAKD
jgi:hypothetical protein